MSRITRFTMECADVYPRQMQCSRLMRQTFLDAILVGLVLWVKNFPDQLVNKVLYIRILMGTVDFLSATRSRQQRLSIILGDVTKLSYKKFRQTRLDTEDYKRSIHEKIGWVDAKD